MVKYAADALILVALALLSVGLGVLFGSVALACFVGAGGCLGLGLWIGIRGGGDA